MDKIIKILEEKKIIVVGLFLIISLIVIFISIPKGDNTKTKGNSDSFRHREEGIVKEEEYKGIKLTNIKMVTEDGYTTFKATVTNVSEEDIKLENFYIDLKDKNGNSIIKLLGFIPGGLKKGEVKKISASAKGEFRDAYSKEITDYTVTPK